MCIELVHRNMKVYFSRQQYRMMWIVLHCFNLGRIPRIVGTLPGKTGKQTKYKRKYSRFCLNKGPIAVTITAAAWKEKFILKSCSKYMHRCTLLWDIATTFIVHCCIACHMFASRVQIDCIRWSSLWVIASTITIDCLKKTLKHRLRICDHGF